MRKLTPVRARAIRESALAWVAQERAREQAQESATSSSQSDPVEPSDLSSLLGQERSPNPTQRD